MSEIALDPYIFFTGNCREAMEFYKDIFGGELTLQTYQESGQKKEGWESKIMHAMLEGDVKLMGSDTEEASAKAAKITLSLGGTDEAKLRKIFESLSEGVDVRFPLEKQFWGDIFGSVTDKYGVEWMVNITTAQPPAK